MFRVQSRKNYTGQKIFTQTPSVVSVTNIRYGPMLLKKYSRLYSQIPWFTHMYTHSLIQGMHQEIRRCRTISIDLVKINTSLVFDERMKSTVCPPSPLQRESILLAGHVTLIKHTLSMTWTSKTFIIQINSMLFKMLSKYNAVFRCASLSSWY